MFTLAPVSVCMICCQLVSTLFQSMVVHLSKLNWECLLNYKCNFEFKLSSKEEIKIWKHSNTFSTRKAKAFLNAVLTSPCLKVIENIK